MQVRLVIQTFQQQIMRSSYDTAWREALQIHAKPTHTELCLQQEEPYCKLLTPQAQLLSQCKLCPKDLCLSLHKLQRAGN